ncbi:MAG: HD domain-containing protein, partial [Actinomycetia bacterium]|nr:HD domain-containing protein [Actinomycetes bacterium]
VLAFSKQEIFFNDIPLPEESISFKELANIFNELEIDSIIFIPGIEFDEVAKFISLLVMDPSDISDGEGIQKLFIKGNISHIKIIEKKADEKEKELEEHKEPGEIYKELVRLFSGVLESISQNQTPGIHFLKSLIQELIESMEDDYKEMIRFAMQKNYSKYLTYHSINVMILSICLGFHVGLNKSSLNLLGLSALFHDIGKTKIPQEIQFKNEKLTSQEWETMKNHPLFGAEQILNLRSLNKVAMIVALEHHRGFDLSGYPSLSTKEKTHFFSRLVETVDTFEAITSRRPFRQAFTPPVALQIMVEKKGGKLDPYLIKSFVEMMGLYPVGTLIELTTGEVGVVVSPNYNNFLLPTVKLILNSEGIKTEPREINVARENISQILEPSLLKINPTKFLQLQ